MVCLLAASRQYRDPSVQADSKVTPKTMLGLEQKRWLLETLARSRGTWKIMVTSMPLVIPTGSEYKPDKWESEMGPEPETWRDGWTAGDQSGGYENEMREILRAMADAGQRNVIFVATDVHCSFVYRCYTAAFPRFRCALSPAICERGSVTCRTVARRHAGAGGDTPPPPITSRTNIVVCHES